MQMKAKVTDMSVWIPMEFFKCYYEWKAAKKKFTIIQRDIKDYNHGTLHHTTLYF